MFRDLLRRLDNDVMQRNAPAAEVAALAKRVEELERLVAELRRQISISVEKQQAETD